MAVRVGRRGLSPPSEPTILLRRCANTAASLLGRGGGPRRAFSSSSSSSSSSSPSPGGGGASSKSQKKMTDRLSAVIDALNNRKLPPELRGQRESVRSETDTRISLRRGYCTAMEEDQFENLPGKGKPLDLAVNPRADPLDDTLYRILSKNGCAPLGRA